MANQLEKVSICTHHIDFELGFFCCDCLEYICPQCVSISHVNHNISKISCAEEIREGLAKRAKKLDDKKNVCDQSEEIREGLADRAKELDDKIHECDQLLEKVDEVTEAKLHDVDQQREVIVCEQKSDQDRITQVRNVLEKEETKVYALLNTCRETPSMNEQYFSSWQRQTKNVLRANIPRSETLNSMKRKYGQTDSTQSQDLKRTRSTNEGSSSVGDGQSYSHSTCTVVSRTDTDVQMYTLSTTYTTQEQAFSESDTKDTEGAIGWSGSSQTEGISTREGARPTFRVGDDEGEHETKPSSTDKPKTMTLPDLEGGSTSGSARLAIQVGDTDDGNHGNKPCSTDKPQTRGAAYSEGGVSTCSSQQGKLDGRLPDLLLWNVAEKVNPENYTKLGLHLLKENVIIKTIKRNEGTHVEATYAVLIKWKTGLPAQPIAAQYKLLADALVDSGEQVVADWLKEEQQKV